MEPLNNAVLQLAQFTSKELSFAKDEIFSPLEVFPKLKALLDDLYLNLEFSSIYESENAQKFAIFFVRLKQATDEMCLNNSARELVLACSILDCDSLLHINCANNINCLRKRLKEPGLLESPKGNKSLYCCIPLQIQLVGIEIVLSTLTKATNRIQLSRSGVLVNVDSVDIAQRILDRISLTLDFYKKNTKDDPCTKLLNHRLSQLYAEYLVSIEFWVVNLADSAGAKSPKQGQVQTLDIMLKQKLLLLFVETLGLFSPLSSSSLVSIILNKYYPEFLNVKRNKIMTEFESKKSFSESLRVDILDDPLKTVYGSYMYTKLKTIFSRFGFLKIIEHPSPLLGAIEEGIKDSTMISTWIILSTIAEEGTSDTGGAKKPHSSLDLEKIYKLALVTLKRNSISIFYLVSLWANEIPDRTLNSSVNIQKSVELIKNMLDYCVVNPSHSIRFIGYRTIQTLLQKHCPAIEHEVVKKLMPQSSGSEFSSCLISILRKNINYQKDSEGINTDGDLSGYYLKLCGEFAQMKYYQMILGDFHSPKLLAKYCSDFLDIVAQSKPSWHIQNELGMIIRRLDRFIGFYFDHRNVWLEIVLLVYNIKILRRSNNGSSSNYKSSSKTTDILVFFFSVSQILGDFLRSLLTIGRNRKQKTNLSDKLEAMNLDFLSNLGAIEQIQHSCELLNFHLAMVLN